MVRILELAVSLLLMAASALVIVNVFLRYVFSAPIFGSEDMVLLMILWMSFLGMILVQRENRHFVMPLLLDYLSQKNRRRLELINNVLAIAALAIFCYSAFLLWDTYSRSVQISLGITKTVYAAAAIVGACGMLAAAVINLAGRTGRRR